MLHDKGRKDVHCNHASEFVPNVNVMFAHYRYLCSRTIL